MVTYAFGHDPNTRHFGISAVLAGLVQDSLPLWARELPVRTLSHNDALNPTPGRRPPETEDYILVWASQITNAHVPSIGLADALSSVEWECRIFFNNADPSALEQVSQYITSNVYNKWYKMPGTETVVRGSRLRESRFDQRIDAGFRWVGRLRFQSEVYGALTAGLFENDPDSQEPHSVPLTDPPYIQS